MEHRSIISQISKASFMLFFALSIFILALIVYSYFNNYLTNIQFLETKTIENYKNIITKTNDNIVSRYSVEYKTELQNKKNMLRNRAFLAYSLLQNVYFDNKNKMSMDEMKQYSLKLLDFIRFDNGKGYYNIFTGNGKPVFTPYYPKFKENTFIESILSKIQQGKKNFYIVNWRHPFKGEEEYRKVIFGVYFDKFDWIVVTGFYLEDFQKNFDKQFLVKLKNLQIPRNIGVIVKNKDKIIAYINCQCKAFVEQVRKTMLNFNKFETKEFLYNGKHYTFVANKIFYNNWIVVSYFVNQNVMESFKETRDKLLKSFIFQILLILFYSILSFALFLIYMKRFRVKLSEQFNLLIDFIKKVPVSYEKIELEKLKFREIFEIGKYSNEMVDTIKKLNLEKEEIHKEVVQEKNFLNIILSNLQQGIAVMTPDMIIEYANDYALEFMGYSKDVIGMDFEKLVPRDLPRDKFLFPMLVEDIKKNKKPVTIPKLKLFRNDGSQIYVYLSIAPVLKESAEIEKLVILFFDITEEEKLKREILKLTRAVENAPISIVITNTDNIIEYVNPFFEKKTGWTLSDVKGKKPSILGTKYNQKFYNDIIEKLQAGKTWKGEFLNKKRNGEPYWEQAFIAPIKDKKGRLINFVAVKEDITERKEFIKQLEQAKKKAEIANKSKSEFLANMSHEIRTPMNAIMGFIELVLETELQETQKRYLNIVKESTENLLRILNDILDISKFDSSKIDFENRPFNFRQLINQSSNIFSSKIAEKGLELHVETDEKIPTTLIGDEVRIGQVINNLINNAIKFTPEGSISLKARLVSKYNNMAVIEVSVKDTGIGIPEDKKDKIFDAFSQADSSITRRFGGTGLGLAIASKIVKHYNGKIWVESEENVGSTFFFVIELEISEEEIEYNTERSKEKLFFENISSNILVAEDNETNQILIKEVLELMGINVEIAENGIEAIKKTAEKDYDLILMDWHMPVMDGVEALEILRKIEAGEDIKHEKIDDETICKLKGKKFKVVALTAAAMKREKESLLEKGFDDYLSKPLKTDELSEVLKKYLKEGQTKNPDNYTKTGLKNQNLDYLKELVGDDPELINKLLESFANTLNSSVKEINNGLENKDFERIYRAAHTLKGAAGSMGFKEIADISVKIEEYAKGENKELVKIEVEKLMEMNF